MKRSFLGKIQFLAVVLGFLMSFSGFLMAVPPPPMVYSEWAEASRTYLKHQFEQGDPEDPTIRTLVYPATCIKAGLRFILDPKDLDINIHAIDFEGAPWRLLYEEFPKTDLVHYKFLIKDRDLVPTAYLDFEINTKSSSVVFYFLHLTAYTNFMCEGMNVYQGVQDESEEFFSTIFSTDTIHIHGKSFTTIFGGIDAKGLLFDTPDSFTFGGSQKAKGTISVPFCGTTYTPEIVYDVPNGSYLQTEEAIIFSRHINFSFGTLHIDKLETLPHSFRLQGDLSVYRDSPLEEDYPTELIRVYAATLHVSGSWRAMCKKFEVMTGHGHVKINNVDGNNVRRQLVHFYPLSPHPRVFCGTLATSTSPISTSEDNAQQAVITENRIVWFDYDLYNQRFDTLFPGIRQETCRSRDNGMPYYFLWHKVDDQVYTDTSCARSSEKADPFKAMGFGSFSNPRQLHSHSLSALHSFNQSTLRGAQGMQPMDMAQFAEVLRGTLQMMVNWAPDHRSWQAERFRPQANLFNLQGISNSVPTRFHASFIPAPKKPEEEDSLKRRHISQIETFFKSPTEDVKISRVAKASFATLSRPKTGEALFKDVLTASPVAPNLTHIQTVLDSQGAASARTFQSQGASAAISMPFTQQWSTYMTSSQEKLQSFIAKMNAKAREKSRWEEEAQSQSSAPRGQRAQATVEGGVFQTHAKAAEPISVAAAAFSAKPASGAETFFETSLEETPNFFRLFQANVAEEESFFQKLMTKPSSLAESAACSTQEQAQAQAGAAVTASFRQQFRDHMARETATLDQFVYAKARETAQKREESTVSSRILNFSIEQLNQRPRPHSSFGREIDNYFRTEIESQDSSSEREIESYFQALTRPPEYPEVKAAETAEIRHLKAKERKAQIEVNRDNATSRNEEIGINRELMVAEEACEDAEKKHSLVVPNVAMLDRRKAHMDPALEMVDQEIRTWDNFLKQNPDFPVPAEIWEDYWSLLQKREDLEWISKIMFPANVLQGVESAITVGTMIMPMGTGLSEGSRQAMKFFSAASRSVRSAERNLIRLSHYLKTQTGKAPLLTGGSGETKQAFSHFERAIQDSKTRFVDSTQKSATLEALNLETFESAKSLRIKRALTGSKKGRVTGVEDCEVHHIISHTNKHTKDHELWKAAGMSPDDYTMILPTPKGKLVSTTRRTAHQGRHLDEVFKQMRRKMTIILEDGKAAGWTQFQYKEKLEAFISQERSLLKSGEKVLYHPKPKEK